MICPDRSPEKTGKWQPHLARQSWGALHLDQALIKIDAQLRIVPLIPAL